MSEMRAFVIVDMKVVLAAVRQRGRALEHVEPEFKADTEVSLLLPHHFLFPPFSLLSFFLSLLFSPFFLSFFLGGGGGGGVLKNF